jgi:hypothetical protein
MAEPGGHTPGQAEDAAASHEDTDAAVQDNNAEMETESGGDPGLRPGNNGSPGDVTGSDEDTGRQMADALRYTEDFAAAAMARPELMTMLRAMPGFAEALSSYANLDRSRGGLAGARGIRRLGGSKGSDVS